MNAKAAGIRVEFARLSRASCSCLARHEFCDGSNWMNARIVLTILILLWSVAAGAQTNERLYEDLDFRFVTPGARAIAMGKTFVGLADDATAAYSNPAGLSNLLEQEISLELNTNQIKHHRFIPSDSGETQSFGDRVYTPSFFSYAIPRGSFTFSVFRNVVQDYQEQFAFRGRYIPSIHRRENGAFGDISISAVNYGLGGSYLVNRYLSVGGSAILSHLDINTHGGTGLPQKPRNETFTDDTDQSPSFIVGVLVKPTTRISLGAVYNSKSTFHLETKLSGQFFLAPHEIIVFQDKIEPIDYVIPDRVAAGASWKLRDSITVCLDVARIRYSQQITENFLILDFMSQLTPANYHIRDVTEIHAGMEYRFYTRSLAWAFRSGVFTDPSHPLLFRGLPGTPVFASRVEGFRFNDQHATNEVGGTFGVGLAIGNRVQIDSAFSFARDSQEIVLSWVWKL